uniref:Phospholipid/glycerol acyltransferase domain-containing protein n=1 Tax=Hyaloperonospora arabidopsidis (strain Emoy2) TaxID=559515 RepID=M4BVL6_HYAAE
MEKYSRWADLTTGINPFVPQRRRFASGWPVTILQVTCGSLLALVRLPLVLVVTVALVVVNIVVSILTVIPFVGRLLKRLIEYLLCSLLLLLFGVFTSEEAANMRRLGLVTGKTKSSKSSSRVGRGDVVVCNSTSFLEVLYLAKRFSPVFVYAIDEKSDTGNLVHVCGLLEALYRSLTMPVTAERVKPTRKIADVVRRASGPIVLLPEGARSNGKAVLRFTSLLQNLSVRARVHLMAFRYEFKRFSPSHTAGGAWPHLFWTAFHLYHTMRVTLLNARDLNLNDLTSAKQPSSRNRKKLEDSETLSSDQVEKLRSLLAAMLRTKTVDLGLEDFVSFNNYWNHVNSGGRQPAAQFTDRKAPHEHAQWAKKPMT